MKTLAFFNPKGGVGTTTFVYHLAWMFQELGVRTVAIDLDPQANLTESFLSAEELQDLWLGAPDPRTVLGALEPWLVGNDALEEPVLRGGVDHPPLLPGHLGLSSLEQIRNEAGDPGLQILTAVEQVVSQAARISRADLVLLDPGPALGLWHRAAVLASDHIILPLSADLYSVQGLQIIGSLHPEWRKSPAAQTSHRMQPLGYVLLERALQGNRPFKASPHWIERIPTIFHEEILGWPEGTSLPKPDLHRLGTFRYFPSLAFLAQEARKPMFLLRPADGAVGGLVEAVFDCYRDFKALAIRIADTCGIAIPSSSAP
jgi:chromosome partitioning protein